MKFFDEFRTSEKEGQFVTMRRDWKGNRASHENVETNDPLVSALVPLDKQVVRQQHPNRIILYRIWREPARFFSPFLIKSGSQWTFRA